MGHSKPIKAIGMIGGGEWVVGEEEITDILPPGNAIAKQSEMDDNWYFVFQNGELKIKANPAHVMYIGFVVKGDE